VCPLSETRSGRSVLCSETTFSSALCNRAKDTRQTKTIKYTINLRWSRYTGRIHPDRTRGSRCLCPHRRAGGRTHTHLLQQQLQRPVWFPGWGVHDKRPKISTFQRGLRAIDRRLIALQQPAKGAAVSIRVSGVFCWSTTLTHTNERLEVIVSTIPMIKFTCPHHPTARLSYSTHTLMVKRGRREGVRVGRGKMVSARGGGRDHLTHRSPQTHAHPR
jgi:hypothetical protein